MSTNVNFPDLQILKFQYLLVQLNQLDWRVYLERKNPMAAALITRMKIAKEDRPYVKLECLRMIVGLTLDAARTRLLFGFVDIYLRLTEDEKKIFEKKKGALKSLEQEKIMEITTSWLEEGRALGIQEGIKEGIKEGRASGIKEGRASGIEEGRASGASRRASGGSNPINNQTAL